MKKILFSVFLVLFSVVTTASAYNFYYDLGEGYSFNDVPEDAYYYEAAYKMLELGVIQGYGTPKDGYTSFGPNDNVTRAQMATMLFRYHNHIIQLNQEVENLKSIICKGIEKESDSSQEFTDAYTSICTQ